MAIILPPEKTCSPARQAGRGPEAILETPLRSQDLFTCRASRQGSALVTTDIDSPAINPKSYAHAARSDRHDHDQRPGGSQPVAGRFLPHGRRGRIAATRPGPWMPSAARARTSTSGCGPRSFWPPSIAITCRPSSRQSAKTLVPFEGYTRLLGRRFEEAVDEFRAVEAATRPQRRHRQRPGRRLPGPGLSNPGRPGPPQRPFGPRQSVDVPHGPSGRPSAGDPRRH